MKILVNLSVLSKNYRGMGIFTKQIVKELVKNNNYKYIFVSGNNIDIEIYKIIRLHNCVYTQVNTPLPIFEQVVLPFLILKYKPDICWFPSNTFPIVKLRKTKYITTIHDMIFFSKLIKPKKLYQKIGQLYRKYNILFGIKQIDVITSVSETSLKEINNYFKFDNYDTKNVLYNSFYPLHKSDNKILEKLNITNSKYFYSIAGIAPHKNLDLLIKSFQKFQKYDDSYKLVISGASNSKYNDKYTNIIFTPFISDFEKVSLIKNAELFIFPSLIEGFGIPLIEGLYYNTNVLVSNIPIFKEIGKHYVKYFNPRNDNFLLENYDNIVIEHKIAKQYIEDNFNIYTTTRKLEKIFNEFK